MIFAHPVTSQMVDLWPIRKRDDYLFGFSGGRDALKRQLKVDDPALAFSSSDGRPLLMTGIVMMGNGRGELWSWPTNELRDHLRPMISVGKKYLLVAMNFYDLTCVEAWVEQDWSEAQRFARLFGFARAGNELFEPPGLGVCFERWQIERSQS